MRRRINFFRGLVALPADISFDAAKSAKCQQAALMMARNGRLSHNPPPNWVYYTADGAAAAAASNLTLGAYGPAAITGLVADTDSEIVGHRRWIFYSRAQIMGTGDLPADAPYSPAHASWVSRDFKPAPAPQFVAWPNRGSPYRGAVVAFLSGCRLHRSHGDDNSRRQQRSGDRHFLLLRRGRRQHDRSGHASGLPTSIAADTTFHVGVTGIAGAGVPASYSYPVTFFDPRVLGDSVTIAGTNTPPTSGATYTFNSIAQADNYELRISTATSAACTEGAEDAPTPQDITGAYPLRQAARKQTGAKGFQLAFPDLFDQSFEITRDLIPSASSQLQFYEQARGTTETCTFDAEVSTNGGANWSSVYQRPGPG